MKPVAGRAQGDRHPISLLLVAPAVTMVLALFVYPVIYSIL